MCADSAKRQAGRLAFRRFMAAPVRSNGEPGGDRTMRKIYFDSRRCLGCRSCEFACAVEHSGTKDPHRAHLEADAPVPRRNVQPADGMTLTVACRHCEGIPNRDGSRFGDPGPAPCVEACMAGAMRKDPLTGRVACDEDKCVGCWMCVMVCPFDAVRAGKTYSIKCDMCPDRDSPACLEACPTQALFEADADELQAVLQRRRGGKEAKVSP